MRIICWIFLICWTGSGPLFAQEYSYTHYDVADGLASSFVYCITQDKEGFIWVGTEAGVSRFDGRHFSTYTSADGLPGTEILQLFADSKGRVWMAPFSGSVCYYLNGQIHNPGNDSLLAAIRLRTTRIENFAEDAKGNLLIQEKTALHLVDSVGRVRSFDSAGGARIDSSVGCSRNRDGSFNVQIGRKMFELSDKGPASPIWVDVMDPTSSVYIALSPSWGVWRTDTTTTRIRSLVNGRSANYPFGYPVTSHDTYSIVDDSLMYDNQYSGTVEYDMRREKVIRRFLPGKRVSRTFRDQAGNLWFTTSGNGLYRLNSNEIRTIRLPEAGIGVSSVHTITLNATKDRLLVGDNHHVLYPLTLPELHFTETKPMVDYGLNRVMFVHDLTGNRYLFGTDAFLMVGVIGTYMGSRVIWRQPVKAGCMIDDHRALVGGASGAGIVDLRTLRVTDTLWRKRITTVYSRNDTLYLGTLQGLWRIAGKEKAQFLGDDVPFLRNRISAITESTNGILWVASYDAGIIGYDGGKVIARFTARDGLIGNVCHCMYLNDGILWVGTDKGLNKIELNKPGQPITCYTADDGLASDVVNVIYAIGSTTYIGTTAGLSYFDETKLLVGDECRLDMIGVVVSGRNRIGDSARLLLSFKETNIRFDYAGISYRSAGKIGYRYRLIGLDSVWKETHDDHLAYPTLPSGDYKFQLQAVNRFGRLSGLRTISFEVAAPFWNQVWFRVLLLAAFLFGTWLFAAWRIRRIRRVQEQKEKQSRRMAELEHIALQSQMNPHFIFNCLNSIQQFVFDKDMLSTNEYITGFARLIRATLNHSSRNLISFAEEVEYLTDYLSLEKMRFKNKMDFFIEVDPSIDMNNRFLPPMLLQPYVENAVRHGLRHKMRGQGYIRILIRPEGEKTVVTIRDNGIGRKQAKEYQTREHIEYQSKGMSLTAARIQMIDVLYKTGIDVQVEDLQDEDGLADGTLIMIRFPAFFEQTGGDG